MRLSPYYLFAALPYVLYGLTAIAFGRGGVHGLPVYLLYLMVGLLIGAACVALATLIVGLIYARRARQSHLPTTGLNVAVVAQAIFLAFLSVGTFL